MEELMMVEQQEAEMHCQFCHQHILMVVEIPAMAAGILVEVVAEAVLACARAMLTVLALVQETVVALRSAAMTTFAIVVSHSEENDASVVLKARAAALEARFATKDIVSLVWAGIRISNWFFNSKSITIGMGITASFFSINENVSPTRVISYETTD